MRPVTRALTVCVLATCGLLPAPPSSAQLPQPVETLLVEAADPGGATTATSLEAFGTYLFEASGRYWYDARAQADAECSAPVTTPVSQPGWQRYRYAFYATDFIGSDYFFPALVELWDPDPLDDPLDLYVDGRNWEWIPTGVPDGAGCAAGGRYSLVYVPSRTGPVNLRIVDLGYADNSGSLSVTVERLAAPPPVTVTPPGRHVETVLVHSHDPAGARMRTATSPGRRYLAVARGVYNWDGLGFDLGGLADARCSRTSLDPIWTDGRFGGNVRELWVDGQPVPWRPAGTGRSALLPRCDRTVHYFEQEFDGTGSGFSFRIEDYPTDYADNRGTLSVDVYELPIPLPVPFVCAGVDVIWPVDVHAYTCVPDQD